MELNVSQAWLVLSSGFLDRDFTNEWLHMHSWEKAIKVAHKLLTRSSVLYYSEKYSPGVTSNCFSSEPWWQDKCYDTGLITELTVKCINSMNLALHLSWNITSTISHRRGNRWNFLVEPTMAYPMAIHLDVMTFKDHHTLTVLFDQAMMKNCNLLYTSAYHTPFNIQS